MYIYIYLTAKQVHLISSSYIFGHVASVWILQQFQSFGVWSILSTGSVRVLFMCARARNPNPHGP